MKFVIELPSEIIEALRLEHNVSLMDRLLAADNFVDAARIVCRMKHGAPPSPQHDVAYIAGHAASEHCINPKHLCWSIDAGAQLANLFRVE